MADYKGKTVPTHEEVAAVLDAAEISEVAKFVREIDARINCWGDMLFIAQEKFDRVTCAAAIRELDRAGWGVFVAGMFCPHTDPELVRLFHESKKDWERVSSMPFMQRIRHYVKLQREDPNIQLFTFGRPGKLRSMFYVAREQWMRERGLSDPDDPNFVSEVVKFLEE